MDDLSVAQSELQCANCAGQCIYDPAQQALVCTSCATRYGLETDKDAEAAREFDFDPVGPNTDVPVVEETRVHHCQTCGGDVVFVGQTLSERCAYCDGPVVLATSDTGYRTKALIPFRVPERDAQVAALAWVAKRWAAPADLKAVVSKGRVAGLYVPFWTFDSEEAVSYWAKYTVRRNKRSVTRRTSGAFRIRFDDLLVPASPHVTPLIRDGILHDFDPRRLRSYRPGYLAGFGAERHHQSVAEGLRANADDKDLLIRNRIKGHVNKRGVHDVRYSTDTTGIRYRRILLPVWILHYKYNDDAMKVVVCGMQGRTYGERPFSWLKLAGYAAVLSALIIAFGLAWGAGGLL
ncbi:hypothetical protein [Tateyamaria omphalii]|uniref:Primosomal protein N' (Replication factor Y)-superfamily II helicase n=1 Tax=Tateyamaria omphalii TaxID=299262 RepID=A0A1P8MU55_9RHOB|nr:hypothetical protein [Tateyamaria omphalii]APX11620.1 hypothetical protein BWR18_07935 [Tateyamaria omphalii]